MLSTNSDLVTFQSAPLREGRHEVSVAIGAEVLGFNPRPCARGDPPPGGGKRGAEQVSIRAPARGATRGLKRLYRRSRMFQSAPLREGRLQLPDPGPTSHGVSIRAPARGATCNCSCYNFGS